MRSRQLQQTADRKPPDLIFFLCLGIGRGRRGTAEQQGAPFPFPWDPWGPPYHRATVADVIWFFILFYKVKQVCGSTRPPIRS